MEHTRVRLISRYYTVRRNEGGEVVFTEHAPRRGDDLATEVNVETWRRKTRLQHERAGMRIVWFPDEMGHITEIGSGTWNETRVAANPNGDGR